MNTDLPAGRELDALVAEKVMGTTLTEQCDTFRMGRCDGYTRKTCGACGGAGHGNCHGMGEGPVQVPCEDRCTAPAYSTDIAAAWTVVEKLCPDHDGEFHLERNVDGHQGTGWEAHFGYHTGNSCRNVYANADTAPLAICRAALSAVKANP